MGVWCIIALFSRKRIFKWLFVIFVGARYALTVYSSIDYYISYPPPADLIAITPWYYYITVVFAYLYPIAILVYVLVSRRVKRTFVYPTSFNFQKIAAFFKAVPRFGLPDDSFFTDELKQKLDAALSEHHVRAIGNGYVDLIAPGEYIRPFVEKMCSLGVRIRAICWWSASPDTGTFEETNLPLKEFKKGETYEDVLRYLEEEFPASPDHAPGLVPGFWLDVPAGWRSDCKT